MSFVNPVFYSRRHLFGAGYGPFLVIESSRFALPSFFGCLDKLVFKAAK